MNDTTKDQRAKVSVWCDWPVQSSWEERSCGRPAGYVEDTYGSPDTAFCWQHEDKALLWVARLIERETQHGHHLNGWAKSRVISAALGWLESCDLNGEFGNSIESLILRRLQSDAALSPSVQDALLNRMQEVLADV